MNRVIGFFPILIQIRSMLSALHEHATVEPPENPGGTNPHSNHHAPLRGLAENPDTARLFILAFPFPGLRFGVSLVPGASVFGAFIRSHFVAS